MPAMIRAMPRATRSRPTATETLLALIGFLCLYLATHHIAATLLMIAIAALLWGWWRIFRLRLARYAVLDPGRAVFPGLRPSQILPALLVMVALSVGLALWLDEVALRGLDDPRMIWAFHEDEGWLSDLYTKYLSQRSFDLGSDWGYTYGSVHIMLTTLVGRVASLFTTYTATDAILFNRLLNLAALIGTGWLVFWAATRYLGSPLVGVMAAALLYSNAKVVEISELSNFPDVLGMFFLSLAFLGTVRALVRPSPVTLFWAPILLGVGMSVKYMGAPLAVLQLIVFGCVQARLWSHAAVDSVPVARRWPWRDFVLYALHIPFVAGLTFFFCNPYYALHPLRFAHQMYGLSQLYSSGNLNHLPASGLNLPGLADWWREATTGGEPDESLFVVAGGLALAVWGAILLRRRAEAPSPGLVLLSAAGLFALLWIPIVTHLSKFAFFHYFMPILPWVYLLAVAPPFLLAHLLPPRLPYRWLPGLLILGLVALILYPITKDRAYFARQGISLPGWLGEGPPQGGLSSRFARSFQIALQTRGADSFALQVGYWLSEHVPDARSAITNETIFYYPPFIEDLRFMNRQLTLERLFNTMPDLLLLSDYFIDMYSREYSPADLAQMSPATRQEFIASRAFFSLVQGKGLFNYEEIHAFDAPGGWYWKRLHVYRRQGPRYLGEICARITAPPLHPSPNGLDALSPRREDGAHPAERYLAAVAGQALPAVLQCELNKPTRLAGMGIHWLDSENYPAQVSLRGTKGDVNVFEVPVEVKKTEDGTAYSWTPAALGEVDKLTLRVNGFVGQQRLLLRNIVVKVEP
jgi:hypothetical protein